MIRAAANPGGVLQLPAHGTWEPPFFSGPVITADQMRAYGKEALDAFRSDIEKGLKPSGRRAGKASYLEGWAQRYWRSQQAVERDRLRQGKAKHRAHRDPIPGKPGQS